MNNKKILWLIPICLILVSCGSDDDINTPVNRECVEYEFGSGIYFNQSDVLRMCEETKADMIEMTNQSPFDTTEECIVKLEEMIGLRCHKWNMK